MGPEVVDVVVVGGGPAGMAAALWLGRYRRRTLVVDGGTPRNFQVEHSSGYLGFDGAPPGELRLRGLAELAGYDTVEVRAGDATSAARVDDDCFEVTLEEGAVQARRLVLCTGVTDLPPDIDGVLEHYGADVFTCPACDGYESRDRDVVLFGWTEELGAVAKGLTRWARSVTVVTDGRPFEGSVRGVEVVETPAVELVGPRGALSGVRLADGRVLPCTVAFFHISQQARNRLALALDCTLDSTGAVVVDDIGQTSVPGVFAAGDLTPGIQLIARAVSTGTVAGIGCALSLGLH